MKKFSKNIPKNFNARMRNAWIVKISFVGKEKDHFFVYLILLL